tara:strand:- start:1076 stop:1345 length:270 start_codon:yes stop_codon:yes gene_type:complete
MDPFQQVTRPGRRTVPVMGCAWRGFNHAARWTGGNCAWWVFAGSDSTPRREDADENTPLGLSMGLHTAIRLQGYVSQPPAVIRASRNPM